MAPKIKFDKKSVVDAAFQIAKDEGIDSITARKVAAVLGSSVAPIYVCFRDVNELTDAVIERTLDVSLGILQEFQEESPFRAIGLASLRFALRYRVLFNDLIFKNSVYLKRIEVDRGHLVGMMRQDPGLAGLTDDELLRILTKMRIFTLGLSVMGANGMLPAEFGEEAMIEILDETSADIIASTRMQKH